MKILVIGNVRPGHQALVDLGHDIVVLMRQDHSHEPDVKFPYRCLTLMDNNANSEEYVSVAAALHKYQKFDRVACFNDTYQAFAVDVANNLKLPYPHTLSMVNTLNDKYLTRKQLNQKGLDDTHCQLIDSVEELADFAKQDPRPFIVKPLDANASLGVSKVNNSSEIPDAIAKLQDANIQFPVLVETFLEGPEYSVEAMSENGVHVIIGITEKIKDEETFIELGHIFPTTLDDNSQKQIHQFVTQSLTALGVTDGPSHTEIIVTDKGPRIVETHSRAGGDNIFRLMELATGISIYQYEARQLSGESVLSDLQQNKHSKRTAAIKFLGLGFEQNAHFSSVENLEEASKMNNVDQLIVLKKAGDSLPPMKSSRERAAFAVATGESSEQAIASCTSALNQLKFNINVQNSLG